MKWTPNCNQAPHYWTLWTPLGFQIEYRVMLILGGFMPTCLDYSDEDAQWKGLRRKGFHILADAMEVCEDAYRKDEDESPLP